MERTRYINGCIWAACIIMVCGFLAIVSVNAIATADKRTIEITEKYKAKMHDVHVELVGNSVSWTTNDNAYRCFGRWQKTYVEQSYCIDIVQTPVEELNSDG